MSHPDPHFDPENVHSDDFVDMQEVAHKYRKNKSSHKRISESVNSFNKMKKKKVAKKMSRPQSVVQSQIDTILKGLK